MAITNPPPITDAPAAPDRAQRSTFSVRATALASYIQATLVSQLQAITQWIFSTATETYNNAVASQAGAASANYKGAWSSLAGALNIPASVTHLGRIWLLVANTANVTTIVPGTSGQWQEISPRTLPGLAPSGAATITSSYNNTTVDASGAALTFPALNTLFDGFNFIVAPVAGTVNTINANFGNGNQTLNITAPTLFVVNGTSSVRFLQLGSVTPAFGSVGSGRVLSNYNSSTIGCCALSATRAFVVYPNTSNQLVAELVDATGATVATSAVLNATAVNPGVRVIALNATDALVLYRLNTNAGFAQIIRDAGAAVTLGTATSIPGSIVRIDGDLLSATKAVVSYTDTGSYYQYAFVLGIAGLVLTANASVQVLASGGAYPPRVATAVAGNGGRVMVNFPYAAGGNFYSFVLTEASNALTVSSNNPPFYQPTNDNPDGNICSVDGAGRVIGAFGITYTARAALFDFVSPNMRMVADPLPISTSASNYNPHVIRKLSAQTFLKLNGNSQALHLEALGITGNRIALNAISARIAGASEADLAILGTSVALVAYNDGSNSNYPTIKTVALGSLS